MGSTLDCAMKLNAITQQLSAAILLERVRANSSLSILRCLVSLNANMLSPVAEHALAIYSASLAPPAMRPPDSIPCFIPLSPILNQRWSRYAPATVCHSRAYVRGGY